MEIERRITMNCAIFLTIRIRSTRTPNKALLEINGETVTDILIKRLQKTKIPIILCTTDEPEDRKYLKPIADKYGLGYHEAPAGNIIKQHLDCAKKHGIDFIINQDGDDILSTPEVIQAVYNHTTGKKHIFPIKTVGLPLGLNVIGYPARKLTEINFDGDTNWGAQIFTGKHTEIKFNYDTPARLTMDYPEDLTVIETILTHCKRNLLVGGICDYLQKHPGIAQINLHLNEEYWKRIENLSKQEEKK
jgi:spore coat polysaccharide biosynthesis protein SpsF (cytidylyltransferase family)